MSIARRFLTGFRQTETNEPGLELNEDGTVDLVNPDGSRTALPGGSSSAVLTNTVTLASVDLLALDVAPFTLVPGVAGKAIVPIHVLTRLHFGSTQYSEAGNGRLFISSTTFAAAGWGQLLNGGIGITGNASGATIFGVNLTGDEEPLTLLDGKALRIDEAGAVTGGDGTLDVTTLYYLLDVA